MTDPNIELVEEGVSDKNFVQQRYFNSDSQACFSCGLTGHISRDCPEKLLLPCFLCGEMGHGHVDCPQDCCFNCGKPGHHSKECDLPKRRRFTNEICRRCQITGHLQSSCPLSWRQYQYNMPLQHESFYSRTKMIKKFCYYCSLEGHFGDECPYRTEPAFTIFHTPMFEFCCKTESSRYTPDKYQRNKYFQQ